MTISIRLKTVLLISIGLGSGWVSDIIDSGHWEDHRGHLFWGMILILVGGIGYVMDLKNSETPEG